MSQDRLPGQTASDVAGESVAVAITKYQEGDDSALSRIVLAFHAVLLGKARRALSRAPNLRSATDSEGAVWSAIESYWSALENGKYSDIKHRNQLLGLLVTIVERKAGRQVRELRAARAGGGRVLSEPALPFEAEGREASPLEAAIEKESEAQAEAVIARWQDRMREKGLLDVAELVLEGHGFRQVAHRLNLREAKARRLITTVNALTKEFGEQEKSGA
jgi:hypothetical protein